MTKYTRSSAIAGRPWDAKACQGLLKWTWKWQPRMKWPSNVLQSHQKWHQSKASVWFPISSLYITFAVSHTVFEKFDVKQSDRWPWNMAKVIDSRITWKLSCGHVCKMFGRQWTNEAKITILNDPTLISLSIPREYLHRPYTARNYVPWATFLDNFYSP